MRTIKTKVYKFKELSNQAKQEAINWWREGETFDWIYDEAHESLKEFAKLFDINISDYNFDEHYRSRYTFGLEDTILELSGQRLATYIWNNYKSHLFEGKYYKSWTSKEKIKHRKVKSTIISKETGWSNKEIFGQYWNKYHGGPKLEHSCVFTGMCYDEDLLDPIYKFLDKPNKGDFKDLLEDCLTSLNKSVEDEIKGNLADENVAGTIIANEYEFTKDGKRI